MMTTSGITNFSLNRREIIEGAFELLNIYQPGEEVEQDDMQYGSKMLNGMVKAWEAQEIHLWTKTEAVLFPALNQPSYTFPTANATESYVETTLSSNEIAGQTTLSIVSSTGMLISDYIGIQLDDGTLQWTTISSIPDSASVIVAAPLTSAAAEGNIVVAYTTKIGRPLQIYSARRNTYANNIDTPLTPYAYQEYFDLPNKNSPGGYPSCWMYNPQRDTGIFYLWQAPSLVTDKIRFTYARSLQIFSTATNTSDFPQEWIEVLQFQLAIRLSHRYGKRQLARDLKNDADAMLQELLFWDSEQASIYIQPSRY